MTSCRSLSVSASDQHCQTHTMDPIIPVILSGGSGSRLWPLSRELYPKQLLPLTSEQTLLQQTATRLAGIAALGQPLVVCNQEHRFLVAEQLRNIGWGDPRILLEPVGRNTAPAVAVAALEAAQMGGDPLLLVLPADHIIQEPAVFRAAVEAGRGHAAAGALVTFGIVPDYAETGYGYIRRGTAQSAGDATEANAYQVDRFVEKPDRETAERYLADGGYYWNSGMFLFRASRYIEELGRFRPDILNPCRDAHVAVSRDLDFLRLEATTFGQSPSESIDYAVMEQTAAARVVPLSAGWSDVGSWQALWSVGEQDDDGNVIRGDVLAEETAGSYLHADHRLIATVGLKDHIVVETADAVLVAPRERSQEVKRLVKELKSRTRPEAVVHRRVYRPWGCYESIDSSERFQVKRITVNPGQSLSLQMHHHRAEHWIIVRGTAKITRGDEEFLLSENQSTFIPLGTKHRLENPGRIPLDMIEVQSGSYLGEDDIVRFQDVYGRSK